MIVPHRRTSHRICEFSLNLQHNIITRHTFNNDVMKNFEDPFELRRVVDTGHIDIRIKLHDQI